MKRSLVLFFSMLLLLSAFLAGCPPFGRHGHGRGSLPRPPVPGHR